MIQQSSNNHIYSIAHWQALRYFGLYRVFISLIFVATYFVVGARQIWNNYDTDLFLGGSIGYFVFAAIAVILVRIERPSFDQQLNIQVAGDVGFIVTLMHAVGGVKSGLGLMLIIVIAAASLISDGRRIIFFAALASIFLLLEQAFDMYAWGDGFDDFTHTAILCGSCFATAWLARIFADRTQLIEALASQRGLDLENLSHVNQLITHEMQDGILVVDGDFKLRHFNNRSEMLLGSVVSANKDHTLKELAPEIDLLLKAWVAQGKESRPESLIHSLGGRELRLRFMALGDDRRQGAVIFIEDWSRVQSQALQLKLAALGRLTANIAHEIRNPLSAISHANQLLLEEENTPKPTQRLYNIIQDNVQRLDQIVSDVLELNRRDRAQAEGINLITFLSDFRAHFCQVERIPIEGFKILMDIEEAVITFDRRHLDQILWNLSRNAWRHGAKQLGSLKIHLQNGRRSSELMLDIIDDGPGISPENRTQLFEPFFTTEKEGTGLGLYIARELSEANSAHLMYIDQTRGACFRLFMKKLNG